MISFITPRLKLSISCDLTETLPCMNERVYVFFAGQMILIMTLHFEPRKLLFQSDLGDSLSESYIKVS